MARRWIDFIRIKNENRRERERFQSYCMFFIINFFKLCQRMFHVFLMIFRDSDAKKIRGNLSGESLDLSLPCGTSSSRFHFHSRFFVFPSLVPPNSNLTQSRLN